MNSRSDLLLSIARSTLSPPNPTSLGSSILAIFKPRTDNNYNLSAVSCLSGVVFLGQDDDMGHLG